MLTMEVRRHGDYALRQMVGRRKNYKLRRVIERPLPVDEVLFCDERIGYVARQTSAPFIPILRRMDPKQIDDAIAAIGVIRKAEGYYGPANGFAKYPDAVTPQLVDEALRNRKEESDEDDDDE